MIHIYTGEGKGKTTAALGLTLRALGAGLSVYIAQFTKGRACSELTALKKFKKVRIEQFGTCRFVRVITSSDLRLAKKGLTAVKAAIKSKKYNMVILDEINNAVDLKLIGLKDVISLAGKCPKEIELILTGRKAATEIIEIADLVSDIREIKHYFRKGVKARKGIEY